jgi:hypothetical protein
VRLRQSTPRGVAAPRVLNSSTPCSSFHQPSLAPVPPETPAPRVHRGRWSGCSKARRSSTGRWVGSVVLGSAGTSIASVPIPSGSRLGQHCSH